MSEKDVWWGRVNVPMEERSFLISRERAIDYLNTQQVPCPSVVFVIIV